MRLCTMDLLNTYKLDNEKFLPSAKFVAQVKKISKKKTPDVITSHTPLGVPDFRAVRKDSFFLS